MGNIVYGAVIVLKHETCPTFLFSNNQHYSHQGCSDQQIVAGLPTETDDCLWLVKPAYGIDPALLSETPIKPGDIIRLEHISTKRNLHTHGDHPAPTSKDQLEVTCYGENGIGNADDNWIVELPNGGQYWLSEQRVRLVNQSIAAALHSHRATFVVNGFTYQEVTGHPRGRRDENDYWSVSIRTWSGAGAVESTRGKVWKVWGKDLLSIISSLCSITGITLLALHSIFGTVTFLLVITYALAWMATFAVMLLAIGGATIFVKPLLALGFPVKWGSRIMSWFLGIILGWLTWLVIIRVVRWLIDLTSKTIGGG